MKTKTLNRTPNLTQGYSDALAHQIYTTYPGQAHFANSGPFGATCGDCELLGYYRERRNSAGDTVGARHYGGCKKFHQLTGKHGPVVPKHAAACRHFQRKKEES
jgi:hypothetical protein